MSLKGGRHMAEEKTLQALLNEQAERKAKMKLILFDSSIKVKTVSGEKYLYARKRVAGKNTSKPLFLPDDEKFL